MGGCWKLQQLPHQGTLKMTKRKLSEATAGSWVELAEELQSIPRVLEQIHSWCWCGRSNLKDMKLFFFGAKVCKAETCLWLPLLLWYKQFISEL